MSSTWELLATYLFPALTPPSPHPTPYDLPAKNNSNSKENCMRYVKSHWWILQSPNMIEKVASLFQYQNLYIAHLWDRGCNKKNYPGLIRLTVYWIFWYIGCQKDMLHKMQHISKVQNALDYLFYFLEWILVLKLLNRSLLPTYYHVLIDFPDFELWPLNSALMGVQK